MRSLLFLIIVFALSGLASASPSFYVNIQQVSNFSQGSPQLASHPIINTAQANTDFYTWADIDNLYYNSSFSSQTNFDTCIGPVCDYNEMAKEIVAVPEPGSLLLLGCGLIGLGWYRRHR